jgi:hypothetical protein
VAATLAVRRDQFVDAGNSVRAQKAIADISNGPQR